MKPESLIISVSADRTKTLCPLLHLLLLFVFVDIILLCADSRLAGVSYLQARADRTKQNLNTNQSARTAPPLVDSFLANAGWVVQRLQATCVQDSPVNCARWAVYRA